MEVSEKIKFENEFNELSAEEKKLDSWIDLVKSDFEKLTEDKTFKDFGYVTFDDIKSLTVGEDINLIAIKAPAGTSLEIPDPEQIQNIYKQTLEVYFYNLGNEEWQRSL
jgi:transcription factor E2F3